MVTIRHLLSAFLCIAVMSSLDMIATPAQALSSSSSSSSSTAATAPVAVIGATGRLGRWAVQKLLDQGTSCHLLVRKIPNQPPSNKNGPTTVEACESTEQLVAYFQAHPNVTLYEGDVGNVAALQDLVKDCSACLALWGSTRRSKVSDLWTPSVEDKDPTHAKQVNYQGVCNLIQACEESTSSCCKRIVRITGKGENPTSFFSVLINLLGSFAKAWNYQGEQALRASTLDYTIIRPGVMGSDDNISKSGQPPPSLSTTTTASSSYFLLADNGGDLPVSKIDYRDIATLCVEALQYDNAARCTLTAMTADPTQEKSDAAAAASTRTWAPLLATVQADRRIFPADMLEQHFAAVRSVLYKIGGVVTVLLAVAIKALFF